MIDRRKVLMVAGAILLCAVLAQFLYLLTHRSERRAYPLAEPAVRDAARPPAGTMATLGSSPTREVARPSAVPERTARTETEKQVLPVLPRGDQAGLDVQYAALLGSWKLDPAARVEFLRRVAAWRFAADHVGQAAARDDLQKLLGARFPEFENFERERPVREVLTSFGAFASSRGIAITDAEAARIAALAAPSNTPPPTTAGALAAATGADGQISLVRHAEGRIADSDALYEAVERAAAGVLSRAQRAALDVYLGERILEDETESRASAIVGQLLLETNRVESVPAKP